MTDVGSSVRGGVMGDPASGCLRRAPSGMRHWLPDDPGTYRHETVSVLRGRHSRRLDDLQTLQAVHSQRPRWRPSFELDVGAARDSRRRPSRIGAPAVFWMRMGTPAGAATDTGRRGQFLEGLLAAQHIGTAGKLCESPTAVADAWRKLKVGQEGRSRVGARREDGGAARGLPDGHRQDSVVLDWRPAPQAAPRTGRDRPPQPADAGVRYDGHA